MRHGELEHYGVKGMKWGRKKTEYWKICLRARRTYTGRRV